MRPLNETFGGRDLCAWQPVPGVTWIQTRSPHFARKLSQRSDSRLVARGFAGGYLRTFEFTHPLAWAARLIVRYTRDDMATNEAISAPASPATVRRCQRRVTTAGRQLEALAGQNQSRSFTRFGGVA